MMPQELKAKDRREALQVGLRVLTQVLSLGKSDDPNQDITKSSSLPTLLIQQLKNLLKAPEVAKSMSELLTDLVKNIALLGKASFNKQIGIEPIVLKVFLPLIPIIIKDYTLQPGLVLASIKALGVFAAQASIIPVRMAAFYKDLSELHLLQDLVSLMVTTTGGAAA
jgi:hypothetical protein